jgi:hypothetical protein
MACINIMRNNIMHPTLFLSIALLIDIRYKPPFFVAVYVLPCSTKKIYSNTMIKYIIALSPFEPWQQMSG